MNKQAITSLCLSAALVVFTQVSHATTVKYNIYWTGGSGYSMEGSFSFDSSLENTGVIHANSLQSFSIEGYLNGVSVGGWDYFSDPLTGTFNFNFDTDTNVFLTGGFSSSETGQEWNTTTGGNDCGEFGFVSGSHAQGVCIDDDLKTPESFIYMPESTLVAVQAVPVPAAAWLFGSALLGVLAVRRGRQAAGR